jgi:hypothetical protein
MSVIQKMMRQEAIWWSKGVPDGFGKNTYLKGVVTKCRWEDFST